MIANFRRLLLGSLLALALTTFTGCAENEHRKVRAEQEQHEGEVIEEARGQEMIVE